jgi:D-tagatose-1,6-bisphosphate aldolase subunit GatZ/KbaZ
MREALYALATVEATLLSEGAWSRLPDVMEQAMLHKPKDWAKHYEGTLEEQKLLRRFSYSDRIRYYWTEASVQEAVDRLLRNLEKQPIPETLISAYLPEQYRRLRLQLPTLSPEDLVLDRIRQTLEPYAAACVPMSDSKEVITL